MWHLAKCFHGEPDSGGLMAGFDSLRGLSNLNDSVLLSNIYS